MILMKKMGIFITFLLCYICFIDNAYASCLREDIARVKELAKNITANYEFVGERDFDDVDQTYSLSFDFAGLDDEIYLQEVNYKTSNFYTSGEGVFVEAGKYSFDVYYMGCEGTKLRNIELELKDFNKYSLKEECNGLQDTVDICGEWYQGSITDEYFDSYMKKNHPKKFKFDIDFIVEHKWYVISGFGIIAILGIVIMMRGIKKNRLD